MRNTFNRAMAGPKDQQGISTLAITLLLLAILTVMVLFSSSVGFFDQRTTNNEGRGRLAEQAAEYALNLAGQYLVANRDLLIENDATKNGWLAIGASRRWVLCSDVGSALADFAEGHPCRAERDDARRAQLYFFTTDGKSTGGLSLPYTSVMPTGSGSPTLETTGVGGAAAFNTTTSVSALMCRMDTSLTTPACRATPIAGDRVAITLVSTADLPGEEAVATVKETWGTFSDFTPSSAVPLVASGVVIGKGNVTVVAAPNGGGYGVPASMWAPSDIDIGKNTGVSCGAGGLASVSTCHVEGYLAEGGVARENLKEASGSGGCAGNNQCRCPSAATSATSTSNANALSGHLQGSFREERFDILDYDTNCGSPSIKFFPKHSGSEPRDVANVVNDDSLFEWIFDVDYVVAPTQADLDSNNTAALTNSGSNVVLNNCPNSLGNSNCAVYALVDQYGATVLGNCSTLNTTSSGIYYITGDCALGNVGSKNASVVVVVDGSIDISGVVFGLVFARSNDNANNQKLTGNGQVFGSVVIEGNIELAGNLDIVSDETAASGSPNKLPKNARFGRLPGSWLDARSGF